MSRRLQPGVAGECCRLYGSSGFELKSCTGKRKIMKSISVQAKNRTCSTKKRRISELLENVSTITEESAEVMKHLPVHDEPMLASCGSEKVEDGGRASTQKKLILHPWLTWYDTGSSDASKHARQPDDEVLPPNLEKLLGDLLQAITSSRGDEEARTASTVVDDDHQDPSFAILALPVCCSK